MQAFIYLFFVLLLLVTTPMTSDLKALHVLMKPNVVEAY